MPTLGLPNMQGVYDATNGVPHLVLAAAQPFTIRDNATPIGDLFVVETNAGSDLLRVSASQAVVSVDLMLGGLLEHTGTLVGLYNATPVAQHSTTGQTAGFTAGLGGPVLSGSVFTGGVGATAYTIGDVVRALKNIGAMAA